MAGLVYAGRTFILRFGAVPKPHLWIVLTDPDPKTGKAIAVMLVSERPHTDKTVRLVAGDHPFIDRDSNIDYGVARPFPTSRIEKVLQDSKANPQADLSPALLSKLRHGLLVSSRTPNEIADHCRSLSEFAEPRR